MDVDDADVWVSDDDVCDVADVEETDVEEASEDVE